MILYLDASALVKLYVVERGSVALAQIVTRADTTGTALISRAEVAAALAKAVRVHALEPEEAVAALQAARARWPDLFCLQLTEAVAARADTLAWEYGLRGYDSVHLATALSWQETLGEQVTLATYDHELWRAGKQAGMALWPKDILKF